MQDGLRRQRGNLVPRVPRRDRFNRAARSPRGGLGEGQAGAEEAHKAPLQRREHLQSRLRRVRADQDEDPAQELSHRVARAWLVCKSAQSVENLERELRMGSLVQAIRQQAAFERIWARSVRRRASEGVVPGDRHVPSKQP